MILRVAGYTTQTTPFCHEDYFELKMRKHPSPFFPNTKDKNPRLYEGLLSHIRRKEVLLPRTESWSQENSAQMDLVRITLASGFPGIFTELENFSKN